MIPFTKHLIVAGLFAGVLVTSVSGVGAAPGDFCDSPLIKTWLAERDTAAVEIVREWLRGADEAAVRRAAMELVRAEILLAPCAPPLRVEDFYVAGVEEPDRLPGRVLTVVLAKYGVDIRPAAFFAGRTFRFVGREIAR